MSNLYIYTFMCVCKLAKYVRNYVVFWKNLHSRQKIYTTAGRDGRDKFQVCMLIRNNINNSSNLENLFKHSRDRHLALVTKHNLVSVDPNQTGWTDIRTLVNM